MVICGCQVCKEEVSRYKGVTDVTYFISQLKNNQDKRKSFLEQTNCEAQTQKSNCMLPSQVLKIHSSCDVEDIDSVKSSIKSNKVDCYETPQERYTQVKEFSGAPSPIKRKLDNEYSQLLHPKKLKQTTIKGNSVIDATKEICYKNVLSGYPFTTSNCMDFSSDETDMSDFETELHYFGTSTTLLNSECPSPIVTSHEGDPDVGSFYSPPSPRSKSFADSLVYVPSLIESDSMLELSPDSPLAVMSITGCVSVPNIQTSPVNFVQSPSLSNSIACLPLSQDDSKKSQPTQPTQESSVHLPSLIENGFTPEISPDSSLAVMAVTGSTSLSNIASSTVNVVQSPSVLNSIKRLPLSQDDSEKSQPILPAKESCSQTSKITCTFLEIKNIFIEMILEKLRYFKSFGVAKKPDNPTERDLQMPNVDMPKEELNENLKNTKLEKYLPEFVPINNGFSRGTWELLIEDEARRNYNRKVTLKLNWNSKGGERIKCVDRKGMTLDVRSMQPFVKLKPLKSLKTPIILKTCGEHLKSGINVRKPTFRPKRNVHNSRFRQFRPRINISSKINSREKRRAADEPVVCNVCNLGFTEQKDLAVHGLSCNDIELVKDECLETFFEGLSYCLLDDQVAEKDKEVMPHCSECSETFTDHVLREIHMFITHKSKSWCCNICGCTFPCKATYLHHLMEHQTLQCMICKKLLNTTEELNTHLSHHQSFNFQCKKCSKELPTIFLYQRHMLGHLIIRPFSCSMCTKRFKYKSNLVEHMWLHKPHRFKCAACLQSFTRPHRLNAHIRKAHTYSELHNSSERE
ncbi:zinc finger protein 846-like isoform X2 [Anneissia japonica]|nr:zinc finger protein 846-like isoform X2 [Anneissia japonica]